MQACKDTCLVLLRAKTVVQKLDISNIKPQYVYGQLTLLERLTDDVKAAADKIQTIYIKSTPLTKQYMQLMKCFAALLTALVDKLNQAEHLSGPSLESSETRGPSMSSISRNSSSSSSISSKDIADLVQSVFTSLFCLLSLTCTCCQGFLCTWPDRIDSEYESTRDALYRLMEFFLRSTRLKSQLWCKMLQDYSPGDWHDHACMILSWPLSYLQSIATWESVSIVREMDTLPADFISMLCCLTLEQLDSSLKVRGAVAAAAAAAAAAVASAVAAARAAGDRFWPILTLGVALERMLVNRGSIEMFQTFRSVMCTPAVVHLFKRIIIVTAGHPISEGVPCEASLRILASAVEESNWANKEAARHPSLHSFMQACGSCNTPLLPVYRPLVESVDNQLLHVLIGYMPVKDKLVELRYMIIRAVTQGWRNPTSADLPFTSPPVQAQLRGLYLAAHHCSLHVFKWMRREQQHRQQKNLSSPVYPPSDVNSPSVQQMLTVLNTNPALQASFQLLDSVEGVSDQISTPQLSTTRNSVLTSLRHFGQMPGTVAMLEATLRDAYRPKSVTKVVDTIFAVFEAFSRSLQSDHPATVLACISLAATLRKLLNMLLDQDSLSAPQPWKDGQSDVEFEQEGDTNVYRVMFCRIPSMMVCSLEAMLQLEVFKEVDSSDSTAQQSMLLASPDLSNFTQSLRGRGIHQLTFVLLSSWMRMFMFRLRAEREQGYWASGQAPPWVNESSHEISKRSPRLWTMSHSVMNGAVPVDVNKHPGVTCTWERYALKHFHGRMLPGCCNLGCTSLGGVSEAVLKTQLCSGCQKARYCSVECQKAAWMGGGHSTVCGNAL